jgi:transposase-like protein
MNKETKQKVLELIKKNTHSVKEICNMFNIKPGTVRNLKRFNSKEWSDEELNLIKNVSYSSKEISIMLKEKLGTIRNLRKKLEISTSQSVVMSKPRPHRHKQEIRNCAGKNCSTTFQINQASKKKYCSQRCQMLTQNPSFKGMLRPQRNPNVEEYTRYSRKVHGLSQTVYKEHKDTINPDNHPRTLCGVDGGWQLDHIIPIKECFKKGLSVEEASSVKNLRMLPWKTNLMRNFK